jgi:GR25 family glycosyltransferase involved in LPS biosynthesis
MKVSIIICIISIILIISCVVLFRRHTTVINSFDKIYLINLKRRPDRLKNFLDHYKDSDLRNEEIIKFDAIDGSKLDVDRIPLSELAQAELQQLETTGFRTKHYQLTKGAIGCYLSHVKIWENILKNDVETVLVFEDDAQVPKDILKKINEEMQHIPNDWDIVLFGYVCKKCMRYEKYYEVERFMLTHCYMIKRSAIVKMMNSNTLFPITQQIDSLMSELSSIINIYSVKDKLVKQFNSRTDIQAPLINKEQRKYLKINVDDRIKVL